MASPSAARKPRRKEAPRKPARRRSSASAVKGSGKSARHADAGPATRLMLKDYTSIPVEADSLRPDKITGLSRDQILALPLYHGNKTVTVGDFFEVQETGGDTLVIEGDLSKFKKLGQEMEGGRLVVRGNAGMHLGAYLRGGTIEVFGDTADWAGAEMKGGLIHIHGNTGHRAGAVYRGSEVGMHGGVILVDGNAGLEIGSFMRRGLIAVGGNAGDFAGAHMIAGSILVMGEMGVRAGASMRRGTLVTLKPFEPLPTFRDSGAYRFPFLRLFTDRLHSRGFRVPADVEQSLFRRFVGDMNEIGLGEILILEGRDHDG
ncbi:MAG: formylmethanofuran dehydrogenase subunit C [Acidobacteria bacterium]|nr:formylmethanofuran dehydrogenase subunit C [Acidobacteriota bacterium]